MDRRGEAFVATRRSWHALAEHVLAPARYAATGRIGLRATPGGFGTPIFGSDEQVRVEADVLVHVRDGEERARAPITTLREAAGLLGREAGAAPGVYEPTTPCQPDTRLPIDPSAAAVLADWLGLGTSVLEQLRADTTLEDNPSLVQLWPEHFDLATELGDATRGTRGTFGASPGDDEHAEPYLYVTHWSDVPPDPYWNDTTFAGASLSWRELRAAEDQRETALQFFRRGRDVLGAGTS